MSTAIGIHKCLECRGHFNRYPGYSARLDTFWQLVTIKGVAAYHSVVLTRRLRTIVGGGVVWAARAACGLEFEEEVYD